MKRTILITGGARSGKSAFAETTTLDLGRPAVYIATAEAGDAEMTRRIERHQARRGPEWQTVSAPLDVVGALEASDTAPRLVDCLTLWLANLMHGRADWEHEVERLQDAVGALRHPVVLVTNEVGGGIVPVNELARAYRDAAGLMNQAMALASDEVHMVVAGCPLRLK
jgi:adenosylcobinamide kinase/adenosylcobinamide-phosphate guanylyltransferase